MQAELQAHIAFHLTGRLPQGAFDAHAQSDLHPAIFAGYRDLTSLRYDFPLVLTRGGDGQPVQSLSGLIDGALKAIAEAKAQLFRADWKKVFEPEAMMRSIRQITRPDA